MHNDINSWLHKKVLLYILLTDLGVDVGVLVGVLRLHSQFILLQIND